MKQRGALTGLVVAFGVLAASGAQAKTFRYATPADMRSMDPMALQETFTLATQGAVYEALVRTNAKLGVEPSLAVSWSQPSPTVWRFKLRQNVAVSRVERPARPPARTLVATVGVRTLRAKSFVHLDFLHHLRVRARVHTRTGFIMGCGFMHGVHAAVTNLYNSLDGDVVVTLYVHVVIDRRLDDERAH